MKRRTFLALTASATFVPFAAYAHEFKVGDLDIVHPWSRATLQGADVAAGFLKIVNHGASADRLIAASSEIAATTQLHTMKMEGDVMKMEELKDGIEIPAGATIELKPKSLHIMFMGLKRQLMEHDQVIGELVFEKAGKVEVEFSVESAGAEAPMDMD